MTAARSATLVGREEEMQQLEAAVTAARRGEGTVLLLEGEAGIGKTRLLSEASARFVEQGDIVVRGQAVELAGGDVPYGVVADMLRDLRRLHSGVGRTLDETARATLGDLLTTLTGGAAPQLDRGQLLDSLVTLIETLGRGRLLWWLVEDLHWADASSRDVLTYMIRAMGPAQVLVTMTVRTGEVWPGALSKFVAETVRSPRVSRMRLGPLHNGEILDQVRQLNDGPVSETLLDRVRRLGEGVPFWTEELVLGGLEVKGPVPESVRGLIETRLLRLGGTARGLVEAVSVVDRANHSMLAAVCELDERAVEEACQEAVQHQVLLVTEDGSGFEFRHALLREAVAESLLPGRRRRLHRRWAEELDRASSEAGTSRYRIEAAHHWSMAGSPEKALAAAHSAAHIAEQASGQYEQARLLRRALDQWSAVPGAEQMVGESRSSMVVRCIAALFGSGRYDECLSVLNQELTDPDGPIARLYLRLRRHVVLEELARDDEDDVVADLETAVDTLLSAPLESPWLAPALTMAAYYLSDDDSVGAAQLCERAAESARVRQDLAAELLAVDALAWNLANLGRLDEAIDQLRNGIRQAKTRGSEPSLASMLESNLSWYLWTQGEFTGAVTAARSALGYVRRPHAAVDRAAWISESLAEALISRGEWDEAAAVLNDTTCLSLSGQAAVTLHCLAGRLAVLRGDRTAATDHLNIARQHTPPQEDALLSQRMAPRWLRADLAAARHDVADVRSTLAPLWEVQHPEVASDSLWRPMLLLARVEADESSLPPSAREAGNEERAEPTWRALDSVADRLHRLGPVSDAWRAQLSAEHARAKGADSVQEWEHVATMWESLGDVFAHAYALLREANAHLVADDRDAAAARLTAAREICKRLRAGALLAVIDTLARRSRLAIGADLPRQRPDSGTRVGALTPREREVLALVTRGLDNAGVAAELFISSKTASVHVSNILAKLGASSRTQAASMALRQGLITIEPEDSN